MAETLESFIENTPCALIITPHSLRVQRRQIEWTSSTITGLSMSSEIDIAYASVRKVQDFGRDILERRKSGWVQPHPLDLLTQWFTRVEHVIKDLLSVIGIVITSITDPVTGQHRHHEEILECLRDPKNPFHKILGTGKAHDCLTEAKRTRNTIKREDLISRMSTSLNWDFFTTCLIEVEIALCIALGIAMSEAKDEKVEDMPSRVQGSENPSLMRPEVHNVPNHDGETTRNFSLADGGEQETTLQNSKHNYDKVLKDLEDDFRKKESAIIGVTSQLDTLNKKYIEHVRGLATTLVNATIMGENVVAQSPVREHQEKDFLNDNVVEDNMSNPQTPAVPQPDRLDDMLKYHEMLLEHSLPTDKSKENLTSYILARQAGILHEGTSLDQTVAGASPTDRLHGMIIYHEMLQKCGLPLDKSKEMLERFITAEQEVILGGTSGSGRDKEGGAL